MKTVYAIASDPVNLVIHAATGENKGEDPVGLTFDVSPIGFGKLLQKWAHKTEVIIFLLVILLFLYEFFGYYFLRTWPVFTILPYHRTLKVFIWDN